MPRYPGAHWRPISGHTDGPMRAHLGAVLHVNQSNGSLFNWVAGDHDVSCHFEVYKNGVIEQYLDTSVSSWCQMAGNNTYLSIETEGFTTEPLSDAQIHAIGRLYAWLHTTHGIPFTLAEIPGDRGFAWHGMGGTAWGNHPGCPGDLRKAQRSQILLIAKTLIPKPPAPAKPSPPPAPAPTPQLPTLPIAPKPDGYRFKLYSSSQRVGPVYAFAAGRWFAVDAHTAATLARLGECDGRIHRVQDVTLARLRAAATGRNS